MVKRYCRKYVDCNVTWIINNKLWDYYSLMQNYVYNRVKDLMKPWWYNEMTTILPLMMRWLLYAPYRSARYMLCGHEYVAAMPSTRIRCCGEPGETAAAICPGIFGLPFVWCCAQWILCYRWRNPHEACASGNRDQPTVRTIAINMYLSPDSAADVFFFASIWCCLSA